MNIGGPVFINDAVDDGDGADEIAVVLFVPATDECIKEGDGSKRIYLCSFCDGYVLLFAGLLADQYPMPARRNLMNEIIKVADVYRYIGVIIPVKSDLFLSRVKIFSDVVRFQYGFIKFRIFDLL